MKRFSFWALARSLSRTHRAQPQGPRAGRGGRREPHEGRAALNPIMALPALIDGDEPILLESLAIIEYLDETHSDPPLLPRDPRGRRGSHKSSPAIHTH
jgi:glutathione S-transferase-like protein